MAHYSKIPPRAVFRSQIGTIILTCFVAVGTQDFIMTSVEGLCTHDQPQKFTCAGDGAPMYANSLMWGVLGSGRVFNDMYPLFKWCFLIGFGVAVLFLVPQWYGPVYLPGVRERIRQRVSPRVFEALDRTVFRFVASLLWLNPILIIQGIQHWAPSNMSYKTPGFILSVFDFPSHVCRANLWEQKFVHLHVLAPAPRALPPRLVGKVQLRALGRADGRRRHLRPHHVVLRLVPPEDARLVGQHRQLGGRRREQRGYLGVAG